MDDDSGKPSAEPAAEPVLKNKVQIRSAEAANNSSPVGTSALDRPKSPLEQVESDAKLTYAKADTETEEWESLAINYGTSCIGKKVYANRIGVDPTGCVDCKFEEFFLSAWSVGDPAMLVDERENSSALLAFTTSTGAPHEVKATETYYPDDPSSVYQNYINAHAKFRIHHGSTITTNVYHQHADQWLQSPNSDDGSYLDSQMISPGASYTLEMTFNGSGNRNKVVGDSIFHCHFYPHFAAGMWAMWRTHDTFEIGGSGRAPEPLFFRGNSGDIVEYWHTKLVPNYYLVDDFQVRTPTDILGQQIHLVKFDVTSSDGVGNGFNYEDGTFSPDEVRESIRAINAQRWYLDPAVNRQNVDRMIRTVFTHDHFGPSTQQQTGLYASVIQRQPSQGGAFTDKTDGDQLKIEPKGREQQSSAHVMDVPKELPKTLLATPNDKNVTILFWVFLFSTMVNGLSTSSAIVLAWMSNNRAKAELILKQAEALREAKEQELRIRELELRIAQLERDASGTSKLIIVGS